jgi:hypothetical protein
MTEIKWLNDPVLMPDETEAALETGKVPEIAEAHGMIMQMIGTNENLRKELEKYWGKRMAREISKEVQDSLIWGIGALIGEIAVRTVKRLGVKEDHDA